MKPFLMILATLSSVAAHSQERKALSPVEITCHLKANNTASQEIALHCDEGNETEQTASQDSKADIQKAAPSVATSNHSPFSIVLQTGEYAGLVSPGIAFRFFKRNEATVLGGFVPGKIDGQHLWQVNFKDQVEPFNNIHIRLKNGESLAINPLHLGAGVIYGIHKNLFLRQPSQYPDGYYMPTALRFTFNMGTSVSYRRVTLYVDYVALDTGAISYFFDQNSQFFRDNYGMFGLAGIGTLGFGAKFNLNRQVKSSGEGIKP